MLRHSTTLTSLPKRSTQVVLLIGNSSKLSGPKSPRSFLTKDGNKFFYDHTVVKSILGNTLTPPPIPLYFTYLVSTRPLYKRYRHDFAIGVNEPQDHYYSHIIPGKETEYVDVTNIPRRSLWETLSNNQPQDSLPELFDFTPFASVIHHILTKTVDSTTQKHYVPTPNVGFYIG